MCNLNDKIKETTIYKCYGNPHSPTVRNLGNY